MVTDVSVPAVGTSLAALHEAASLVRTSVEDCPDDPQHPPDHKALSDLRDAVDDLVDAVEQARWAAQSGRSGSGPVLAGVQRAVMRAETVLHGDLLRIDRRFDTARRAARAWGGSWRPWSDVVLTNLLDTADALRDTENALASAWIAAVPPAPHPTERPAQDLEGPP
jgi:hypothetical protein